MRLPTSTRSSLLSIALAGLVAIPLALPATPATAHEPDHGGTDRHELQQQLDAIVAAGATSATAEVDSGRRQLRATSGTAQVGTERPVPHDARFRIGSETKAFLATVVLQLVAEHRLGLDDSVQSVLPGVVPRGGEITIRELLDHTSGLHEVLATLPSPRSADFLKIRYRTWTTAELVARATAYPLDFDPGDAAAYSNTNYLVLGLIVEGVTGRSYAHEIERRIIHPLHLTHTSVPGTDPDIRGPHAHGYLSIEQDGTPTLVDITRVNPSIMNAAGEMISTTHDLNRFFDALLAGRLLPRYLLDQMETPALDSPYGLGILVERLPCRVTVLGKDGDAPGYSGLTFEAPAEHRRLTVSVTWGAGDPDEAVDDLVEGQLCP
jgi:D-alanyl-D-alanine carboxypeptidase